MTEFRKGDVVTVEAVVASCEIDLGGNRQIQLRIEPYHEIFVSVSAITMKQPNIGVGDFVEWAAGELVYAGKVLSIADGHAWVLFGGGEYATVLLSKALRVDPEPVAAEEAA